MMPLEFGPGELVKVSQSMSKEEVEEMLKVHRKVKQDHKNVRRRFKYRQRKRNNE